MPMTSTIQRRSLLQPEHRSAAIATQPATRLVAVAASAGGIPALQTLLGSLPASFPAAIVLVLHRRPRPVDLLVGVLQRSTRLPVKLAEAGEPLMESTVYVAPADRHLEVLDNRQLQLVDGRRISHTMSSADPMFQSAARAFGPRFIAVVLTGSGRNGATGVTTVRERGGTVIAQDRETSAYFAMPAAAIATGAVDLVLPLQRIGPKLIELVNHSPDVAAR